MAFFPFKRQISKKRFTSQDLAELMSGGFGATTAGVSVSQAKAIRFSTVWACVRLLAECIAQLPCHIYIKNRDGSKSRVTDTALAEILSNKPNFWQTPFEYTEFMVTSLAMRGNHYAHVVRDKREILEIIPIPPTAVKLKRDGFENVRFEVRQINGSVKTYSLDEISHVRGLSLDGFTGVSPITYHRETIGLSIAASEYGGKLFKNGARPSGILTFPGELSETAYKRLLKNFQEMYGGGNIGKTAILEDSGDFKTISMSNEDAQYLDVRQFQRTEICSIFRIPPHMIGDLTKSSFSNITQQSLEFVKYTILPWCRRIESAMQRDLLTKDERRKGMFVQYLVDGLERADIETRYKAYRSGINGGFLSPNEVRRKENMNPRPNGDIYLTPLNMVDSSQGLPKPQKTRLKTKQIKGVNARELLRAKFLSRFEKAGTRLVKYEVAQIRSALAQSKSTNEDLRDKLTDLYNNLPQHTEKIFRKLMRQYGVEVKNAGLKEINSDHKLDPDTLSNFIDDLLSAFVVRHVSSSFGQLSAIIRDTGDQKELIEAIEQRLAEWEEKRPAKIAMRETVQQESATSRFVWAAAGISTLIWVLRGSKSCPFCTDLAGKVVGINAPFVEQGNYEPPGHENSPWKVRGPKMHPQIHEGCQCIIAPGD